MEISNQALQDAKMIEVLKDAASSDRQKQKAFEHLYSTHQKQLEFYFLKQIRDVDVAEDLKMVTFEKVHAYIDTYDDKFAFSTWMYKIALNTLIDHKRKEKFEEISIETLSDKTSEDHDGMDFQLDGNSKTPEQEMISKQNVVAVRTAISQLKNKKVKRLMTYRYIDELSYEEIAEREGVEKHCSTLRVGVRRGKKELKKILSK